MGDALDTHLRWLGVAFGALGLAFGALGLFVGATEAATKAGLARSPTNEDLRHIRAMADPRISADGRRVLVRVTETTAAGAVGHLWLADVAGGAPRRLTYGPPADKRGERFGRWALDGASADRKIQLIVSVHGGPTGAWTDGFDPLTNYFVAQGWPMFKPNPRGSSGKGARFAAPSR